MRKFDVRKESEFIKDLLLEQAIDQLTDTPIETDGEAIEQELRDCKISDTVFITADLYAIRTK